MGKTYTEAELQELIKANEQTVLEKAKAQLKQEQLEADTTELVKSMDYVDQSMVSTLVKSIVKSDDGKEILNWMIDVEDIIKATKAEAEEIKAWFGPMNSAAEGTPTKQKGEYASSRAEARTQELEEIVKAKRAEKGIK